ncbi:hypothetical protein KR093_009004 [Drosophila rubida]|uniref:NudC domain-containing protein 1 n=1 Tax=Drosophila rubida TaxID=30044 RepID=A0AAD4KB20_9MUSC|nr:hypothetical protein KR093_009004 [Drosophila rubida]
MPVVDLQVDRKLICPNFDGYKLSFEPVPVLRQSLDRFPLRLEPHANQYSLLHTELFAKHNLLFSDPWARNNCYFMNASHQLLMSSYNEQEGQPRQQRIIYEIQRADHGDGYAHVVGDYNYTLRFISEKYCVLCDGMLTYMLLDTGDRERGATWQLLTRSPVTPNGIERGFVLHDARLDVVQERKQISLVAAHIGRRQQGDEFVSQLIWSRWSWTDEEAAAAGTWSYEVCQQLAAKGSIYYCAFEPRAQSLIICSNGELQTPAQHKAALEAAAAAAQADAVALYDWEQSETEVTVRFTLATNATRDDVKINSTASHLLVEHKSEILLDGALFAHVHEQLTHWTLQSGELELNLKKRQPKHWPRLLYAAAEQREEQDPDLQPPLPIPNLEEPIEDCDLPMNGSDDIKMVRFNLPKACVTHTIFLGATPPILCSTLRPGFPAAFATRHDIDAAIWLQQYQPARPDDWSVRHEGQLHAFGYVQASKEQRKFVDCCPQLDYAVICESYRHVFIYKPRNEAASGLRNRNGPPVVIGKQHLVTLPDDVGEVLGLVTAPKVIIILTAHAILYLQV